MAVNEPEDDRISIFDWLNVDQSDEEFSHDWVNTIQSNTSYTNDTRSSHYSEHKSATESEKQTSLLDDVSVTSFVTNNTNISSTTCHSEHVNSCKHHSKIIDKIASPFLDSSKFDTINKCDVTSQHEEIKSFEVRPNEENFSQETSELINQNKVLLTDPNASKCFNSFPNLYESVQIENTCLSSGEETESLRSQDKSCVSTIAGHYNVKRCNEAYTGKHIGNTYGDKSTVLVNPDYNSSAELIKSSASVQSSVEYTEKDENLDGCINVEQFILDNFSNDMDEFIGLAGDVRHSYHGESLDRRPDASSSDSSSEVENEAVVEIGDQTTQSSENITFRSVAPELTHGRKKPNLNRPNSFDLTQKHSKSATASLGRPLSHHSTYDLNYPEKGKSRSARSRIAGSVRKAIGKFRISGKGGRGSGDLALSQEDITSKNVKLLDYHERPRSPTIGSSGQFTSKSKNLKSKSKSLDRSNRKLEENLRFRPPPGFSSDADISLSEDEIISQKSDDEIFAQYIEEGGVKQNPMFGSDLFSVPSIEDAKESPKPVPRAVHRVQNEEQESESEDTMTNYSIDSSKTSDQDNDSVRAIPRITKANIKGMELVCQSGSLSSVEYKKLQETDCQKTEVVTEFKCEENNVDIYLENEPGIASEVSYTVTNSEKKDSKKDDNVLLNVSDFYDDVTKDADNFDTTSSSSSADELAMQIGVKKDAVFLTSDSENEAISQAMSLQSEELSDSTVHEVKEAIINLSSEGESDIFDFALLLPTAPEKVQYVVEPLVIFDNTIQSSSIYDQGKADDSFMKPVVSTEPNVHVSSTVKIVSVSEQVQTIDMEPIVVAEIESVSPTIEFLTEFKDDVNMVEQIDSALYQMDPNFEILSEVTQETVTASEEETMEDTVPFEEEKIDFQNTTDVTQNEEPCNYDSDHSSTDASTPSVTTYEVNPTLTSETQEPFDDVIDNNVVCVTKNISDEPPTIFAPSIDVSSLDNTNEVSSETPANAPGDDTLHSPIVPPNISFLGVELQSPPPPSQFANEVMILDDQQFESELDNQTSSTPKSGSAPDLSSISSEGAQYLDNINIGSMLDGLLGNLDDMGYKRSTSRSMEEAKINTREGLSPEVSFSSRFQSVLMLLL